MGWIIGGVLAFLCILFYEVKYPSKYNLFINCDGADMCCVRGCKKCAWYSSVEGKYCGEHDPRMHERNNVITSMRADSRRCRNW